MEEDHNASKRGKSKVENGIEPHNGNADRGIKTDNREENAEEKLGLLRELLSLNSEASKLQMEQTETKDSIIHELMRLSGLIAQLRMLDPDLLTEDMIRDFDSLFEKYLLSLKR